LVEGPSKQHVAASLRDSDLAVTDPHQGEQLQLTGRTHCDRIVVFTGNRRQIGHTLPITIYDANAHTLFGEVVTRHSGMELYTLSVQA